MDLDHRESNKQHFNAQIGILLLPVLINLMQVLIGYKVKLQRLHAPACWLMSCTNNIGLKWLFKASFHVTGVY